MKTFPYLLYPLHNPIYLILLTDFGVAFIIKRTTEQRLDRNESGSVTSQCLS